MINIKEITSNLEPKEGVWISKNEAKISYPEDGNDVCFQLENDSFWFLHRNRIIIEAITAFPSQGFIIDVGGGNGFVSKAIQSCGYETILLEPGKNGIENAKKRGLKNLICATFEDAKFIKNSIPAFGLFDVLEHIENDKDFLKQIYSCLKQNGKLYLTVPSYNFLWSDIDVNEHFRRYTLTSITKLLLDTGFTIEYKTYFFSILFFPILIFRALPYRIGLRRKKETEKYSKDHKESNGLIRILFQYFLKKEINSIKSKKSISFGSSSFLIAKK